MVSEYLTPLVSRGENELRPTLRVCGWVGYEDRRVRDRI